MSGLPTRPTDLQRRRTTKVQAALGPESLRIIPCGACSGEGEKTIFSQGWHMHDNPTEDVESCEACAGSGWAVA